jgi:LPPG:FO 2-phospho-L-lactate transferase
MKTVALAGGVGGAKLVSGLAEIVPRDDLTVIVNTGDDFDWVGLRVCPDLDTVLYALAGLANPVTGWGINGDSFAMLQRFAELGGESWFRVGDRDLATHIYRTHLLRSQSLTQVTAVLCGRSGVHTRIIPMTDSFVPTRVHTDEGTLPFQDYFVRRQCAPVVRGFTYCGIQDSRPAPGIIDALSEARAVVVCPSNPFISIGPILAVPTIRQALCSTPARVAAVSPIIRGRALKGPAADMMRQLGKNVSAVSVASLYRDFLDVFVLDAEDETLMPEVEALGIAAHTARTVMDSSEARVHLAERLVEILA